MIEILISQFQDKDEVKTKEIEDGSEDVEVKKEKEDDKAKKKKAKKTKAKSESPEPVCLDGEFKDTQISQTEGSKISGEAESGQYVERGKVATPTHR